MDFNLRLKALAGLASSQTSEAIEALKKTFENIQVSLRSDLQYEQLEQSLAILEVIGTRLSDKVVVELVSFIASIRNRNLEHSGELYPSSIAAYHTSSSLIVRAIEVLSRLRYLETQEIVKLLLELSVDVDQKVQDRALQGLENIANYNLHVFYGDDRQGGIGAYPQEQVLNVLSTLDETDLLRYQAAVLKISNELLSPSIEGSRWDSSSLTISRGTLPAAAGVPEIRSRVIELLKKLYGREQSTSGRLAVINTLNSATHLNVPIGDEDVTSMIAENAVDVLSFYKKIIPIEVLQIVQKIESLAYWIYFHSASEKVRLCALDIERILKEHTEYGIYKTLIGFEGILGEWEQHRKSENYWDETEKSRREKAGVFAESITADNFEEWRYRILSYVKTESNDLATFPIFYYFLEVFAKTQPKLAIELLIEDSAEIEGFLIPILRGLWNGSARIELIQLMDIWISEGRYLYPCLKQFLDCSSFDLELPKRILARAAELSDQQTVALAMTVAVSNYHSDETLIRDIFIPALEILSTLQSSIWIFDIWFRRELRLVIGTLHDDQADLILQNLLNLNEIDFHAEEILYLVAERFPEKVVQFLCTRISLENEMRKQRSTYDAVPFTLHKLQTPLETIPREALQVVRKTYDGNYGMFIFRGGHLLQTIFPNFSAEFQTELLTFVIAGGEENLQFVLAILRNYEGQPFIHNICKEILKREPNNADVRSELYISLQNTGVVTGEYGFAEAYERKKTEIQYWLDDADKTIRDFAAWYVERLDQMIASDRQRADEEIALRKQRFS